MSNPNKLSIKQWNIEDRPREKLLLKGISSLSDTELLAILIRTGTKEESAVDLAKKILNFTNNNLSALGKVSLNDLCDLKGIGETKAITIFSALELGRRRNLSECLEKQKISTSRDVFNLFHPILSDLHHEEFWILLLNRSNRIIEKKRISSGGITGTVIDLKMILKDAIEHLSSAIVLCHNHPSGNEKPSTADIDITKRLSDAAKIMELSILDHIIIADQKYFSFADEGKL